MVGSVLCPVSIVHPPSTAPLCWAGSIDQDYVTDPYIHNPPYSVQCFNNERLFSTLHKFALT